jgi:hypothetical protein
MNANDPGRRTTSAIASITGADLTDPATMVGDVMVIGGAPAEVAKVARHFTKVLRIAVTVDEPSADDPDYTFLRIPASDLAAAISRIRKPRGRRARGTVLR